MDKEKADCTYKYEGDGLGLLFAGILLVCESPFFLILKKNTILM